MDTNESSCYNKSSPAPKISQFRHFTKFTQFCGGLAHSMDFQIVNRYKHLENNFGFSGFWVENALEYSLGGRELEILTAWRQH